MTSPTVKAQRQTIYIGNIPLEVAMLPDGSYHLSQTQVTEAIEKERNSMLRFYRSKYAKSFLGEDFQCYSLSKEILIEGASRPISPVTFELACLYWQKCAAEGNAKARAIVVALVKHSLYDLSDAAFGVKRHQSDRDRALASDLSEAGVERLTKSYQSLEQPFYPQVGVQTEHELKLKIRLVELELEKAKLDRSNNAFPVAEIRRVGVPPWQVIPWVQEALGWACWTDAARLLKELGYGYKTKNWFKLKISGELWVMPQDSFNSLKTAIKQFKSSRS